ncbi:MAG: Helix-turn-helix domain protein [Candidatus Methanofastidiosum methylothiophilum]|uniref:Helix-turn-helix domain protein n=1 Tax=Candidatus Methanofastidiosum methylothiophilum TaxID=1705564 RepID=A0A150IIZ5_9EURY|nr:MAG: Helix-turn-helix domain protein [Candidatus Methanofastidiosum methylthiophilus]KYC47775.1 MAG: Helix-turn-helix domain protein [Candidatus Methanofastidiosum methylthiophilus]KYC49403.1 MAG: Helix-turn-helix domain protein [Candidatus Methanofastidiosum methylthiophilus]
MATLDDVLHVISTDDEKAKIVAMELANDNGRRIIDAFFIEPQSAGDLARKLDIPMPTVMFHIERLMEIGLIDVVDTKLSRKFKDIKYYGPKKTAILIVPSQKEETVRSLSNSLKTSYIPAPTALLVMFLVVILGIGFSVPGIFQSFQQNESKLMSEGLGGNGEIRQMDYKGDSTAVVPENMHRESPINPLIYIIIGGSASLLFLLILLKLKGR